MTKRALEAVDRGVLKAAHGMTRRRLLRNAGSTAFGAAMVTSMLGAEFAYSNADAACGPAPMCPLQHCQNGAKHRCKDARDDTSWRPHGFGYCTGYQGDYGDHCWTGYDGPNAFKCCDCCVRKNIYTGTCNPNTCKGNSGYWSRCICGAPA